MATSTLPYPNPTNAKQYATDLDAEIDLSLGQPIKTDPNAVAVTTAWVQSESPTFPGFNGLGTELKLAGATPDPSNYRVYDYPTLQEGLDAALDQIEGLSPQTTADAPAFAKDVASGTASKSQLVSDIYNSDWAGFSVPDTYDATSVASRLGLKAPSGPKSASGTSTPGNHSWFSTILTAGGHIPGGGVITDVTNAPESLIDKGVSGLAGTVGNYILKGVLSLTGAGLIFYGATLLTGRSGARSASPAATLGGGAAGDVDEFIPFGPEDVAA